MDSIILIAEHFVTAFRSPSRSNPRAALSCLIWQCYFLELCVPTPTSSGQLRHLGVGFYGIAHNQDWKHTPANRALSWEKKENLDSNQSHVAGCTKSLGSLLCLWFSQRTTWLIFQILLLTSSYHIGSSATLVSICGGQWRWLVGRYSINYQESRLYLQFLLNQRVTGYVNWWCVVT